MPYRNFYELEVYKACRSYRKQISTIIKDHFPSKEKFLLSSQLLDASRSITANIAEGHGRYYFKENIHFCRIARGSLSESFEHLICAYDEAYFEEQKLSEMKQQYHACLKQLNAYIAYMKRQSNRSHK